MMTRRDFIKSSALTGGALVLAEASLAASGAHAATPETPVALPGDRPRLPDLSPARWIWYPSERTLPSTFVLFRRELSLASPLRKASGWIAADSRYLLEVNGQRVQWGPAPADPRWPEADPLDLTPFLQAGRNVLAATVLFYGHGDGTWPLGKPGFLFWLELEHADGRREVVASDEGWRSLLCRAWRAGHYKRWYLRALQEEFDARLYPYGWSTVAYAPGGDWVPAMPLGGSPNKPALCTSYPEYALDLGRGPVECELLPRSIPLLAESIVGVRGLSESLWVEWARPPREYFEVCAPGSFREVRQSCVASSARDSWNLLLGGQRGAVLTFELEEQVVGWPFFTIEAPEGTVVELLVHEAHEVGGPPLLNTHFNSWTRFTCRAGVNRFETYDFESLRWLQLHIHGAAGPAAVRDVGVRRRMFPWANAPLVRTDEPSLQRLFDASVNTLRNCAQETLVDGMARERQQYSGDGGHQLHAVHLAFGETRLPARFVRTYSQGLTKDGFFLDCWPAYDRLARIMERELDLTEWGPLLDHGVGFNFDCWHHYNYTGDLGAVREAYPRLLRFSGYLRDRVGRDGLLPVENNGVPTVWIDQEAYQQQRHKKCAYNLYAAAMLQNALGPLCRAFGDLRFAESVEGLGREIQAAAVRAFWSPARGIFVVNLPWLAEEGRPRLCDRSLATALLYDQCPGGEEKAALQALADCPPEMGLSYPCNAGWRLWALGKGGRADAIVRDLRVRWAAMASVRLNNTLQEGWTARPDSGDQWSHCGVAPLYVTYHCLVGFRPLAPGCSRVEIRPQLADLESLDVVACTVRGPIRFTARGRMGDREIALQLPPTCEAEVVLPSGESTQLARIGGPVPTGHARYVLPAGGSATLHLRLS